MTLASGWAAVGAAAFFLSPAIGSQEPPSWEKALDLRAGDFIHATVVQVGMSVAVVLQGPDGETLLEVDDDSGAAGYEMLSFVAEADGRYRLSVRKPKDHPPEGKFEVEIDGPRPATLHDRERLEAERATSEGLKLEWQESLESRRQAIDRLEDARARWRALPDRRGEARALLGLAGAFMQVGDADKAIEALTEAGPLWGAGDGSYQGTALNLMGIAYGRKGQIQRAVELVRQALEARRAAGDTWSLPETLQNLALLHNRRGETQQTIAAYTEAVDLARAVGNHRIEAWALGNLGIAHIGEGDFQTALDRLNEALLVHRTNGSREGEAHVLNGLGTAYRYLGEPRRALEYFERALEIWTQMGSPLQAWALRSVGDTHSELGQYPQARDHLARSLDLSRAKGDRRNEVLTLLSLGRLLERMDDLPGARARYQEGLAAGREMGDRAVETDVLFDLCRTDLAAGDLQQAQARCLEGLAMARAVRRTAREATVLHVLARVDRAAERWPEARGRAEEALALVDSVRRGLHNPDLRASYGALWNDVPELYVDILMELHRQQPGNGLAVKAFEAAEHRRARSLVQLLAESRVEIRAGLEEGLALRERRAREQLQAAVARHSQLLARKPAEADLVASAQEIAEAEREVLLVDGEIRTRHPRYAALTQAQPLSLEVVQKVVLDPQTLLLTFALGERRSYLWAVGQSSFDVHELPPRAVLEDHARRVHAALSSRGGGGEADLAALGRMLLGPVAGSLGQKRLVVVADGALQYVPFAALPDPARPQQPLAVQHELVGLPSAATALWLRRAGPPPDSDRRVAILADPVFDAGDERLTRRRKLGRGAAQEPPVARSEPPWRSSARGVGLGDGPLPRLPLSRWEAKAIAKLAGAGSVRLALDFDANRSLLSDPDLGRYRYLHFATHGFFNATRPELSGLVLSLVDRDGRPQEGFVTAVDIFNLKLAADMVVLSGCRTALGREVRGEGQVGLTRAFLYAGAQAVVASLWPVDDAATAELMTHLYRGLLRDGLHPAAALRAAQVRLWQSPGRKPPHYWAAFQIQGDWH